jgi:hypothetical protein
MKIILTNKSLTEINRLNSKYGEETSQFYDDWDQMNDEEMLIMDASLYSNGAYEENKFNSLDKWCANTAQMEYGVTDGNIVRKKLDKMLQLDLIKIK